MVNYGNSKIYKIEALNGEDGDIYIGSTTKEYLSQRMDSHRGNYKRWKQGKGGKVMAFNIFDKYGVENCNIVLIESVNVNSNDELKMREAHYIKTLACLNKNVPMRSKKEYDQDNKEKIKEYYQSNKEKIKEYRADNKEKMKEYRADNKEAIKEQKKQYYQTTKEKLKATTTTI